jgi:hypothetical protein
VSGRETRAPGHQPARRPLRRHVLSRAVAIEREGHRPADDLRAIGHLEDAREPNALVADGRTGAVPPRLLRGAQADERADALRCERHAVVGDEQGSRRDHEPDRTRPAGVRARVVRVLDQLERIAAGVVVVDAVFSAPAVLDAVELLGAHDWVFGLRDVGEVPALRVEGLVG